jgi:hypothetical protein
VARRSDRTCARDRTINRGIDGKDANVGELGNSENSR